VQDITYCFTHSQMALQPTPRYCHQKQRSLTLLPESFDSDVLEPVQNPNRNPDRDRPETPRVVLPGHATPGSSVQIPAHRQRKLYLCSYTTSQMPGKRKL
jgi:hypothetical protein